MNGSFCGASFHCGSFEEKAAEPALVYPPDREFATRHFVFRRTNLPCLRCGGNIRQLRQKTNSRELVPPFDADGHSKSADPEERTRIIHFCAKCQKVNTERYNGPAAVTNFV